VDTTPSTFFPIILALGWPSVTFPSRKEVRYDWSCGCWALAADDVAKSLTTCSKHDGTFAFEDNENTVPG